MRGPDLRGLRSGALGHEPLRRRRDGAVLTRDQVTLTSPHVSAAVTWHNRFVIVGEGVAVADPTSDEIELAERLLAEWSEGRGTFKSQLELREWGDSTSHGRRFDRFIRRTLGVATTRPSKQTDRISELESQLRRRGVVPPGTKTAEWENQLQHARNAALAALKAWNDPTAAFRTGTFALLFVTAWNSLAIAILQLRNGEWRALDEEGNPTLFGGVERSRETLELIKDTFPIDNHRGLQENVYDWVQLRNCVAHRHLPALDAAVIPQAQAGLLNFETAVSDNLGTTSYWASTSLSRSNYRGSAIQVCSHH